MARSDGQFEAVGRLVVGAVHHVAIAHEIVRATGMGVRFEPTIPVREQVASVCDMLGYDPFYLACEGRVVAVIAPEQVDDALAIWRANPAGEGASRIGRIIA